jgi:hypothetical protein
MKQRAGILKSNRAIILFISVILFAQVCLAKYSGGSGTSGDPYQIGSAADLLVLAANTGDYGANFILTADIDLTGHTFTTAVIARDTDNSNSDFDGPIFTGIFNGNGHTISNLTINTSDAGNDFLGLFGYVSNSQISNICMENVKITGGDNSNHLGGLVGFNYSGAISNCHSTGDVTGGYNSWNLGGLVGWNYDGTINNCFSAGTVAGEVNSLDLGGLAGSNHKGSIIGCFSTVAVTGEDESDIIGGLVGENHLGNISNCYSTGNVTGGNNSYNIGGLVGWNNGGSIMYCYSTGNITYGSDSWSFGGLIGCNVGSISYSYFLVTSGRDNGCGVPLTDAKMKQQSRFVGWDFTNIWQIAEAVSYPKLAWQSICDTAPSPPAGVSASNGTYTDKVRVTWNSVSGATAYEVWRSTSNSSDSASKLGECTSHFDDSGVTPGTTYYYWVKAKNSCGTSNFSSSDSGYASTNPESYYVSVAKCTVAAGSKENTDKISFSGTMNPAYNDLSLTNVIQISIGSDDMEPYVIMIPIGNDNYKNTGKFSYSGTGENGVKKSFKLDFKTNKFSFAAQNVNLSGLSCPSRVGVVITNFVANTDVNETIVNGTKPMPINFLMDARNSLRVDKSKFTRNKKTSNITQVAVSGGFSDENINDASLLTNPLNITVGSQIFTIPAGKFKNTKGKFTCSKVDTSKGIAAATFDFNKCTFTLTIKNTNFAAAAGTTEFDIGFASFSGSDEVTLP